jgi:hypothetical protein
MERNHDPDKEIMELGHEPVPGYKPAFYVVMAVACAYLTAIFILYL